jgi:hypothetical protein
MYPPSTMQNRHIYVIGRSNEHGLEWVLKKSICDGYLSRQIPPLNIEEQHQKHDMDQNMMMQWIL